MKVVIGIIAITEPLEIVNDHRPFEISVLISGVVPFVLRWWPGRRSNPALCHSSIELSPNGEEGCFIEPIPEFAYFNPGSPSRCRTRIDTRTLPSPTTSKLIQDPNPQDRGKSDYKDPDVSDSEDEGATLLIQQESTSRHDQVQLNLVNVLGLSDEVFTLASEGCQEDSNHHS
jgi:hypothetical protein